MLLNIMVYPNHRWYEQIMIPEFSGVKFFEPEIFSKKFQIKFLITEKIQVPRLKTSRKVTSKLNWSIYIPGPGSNLALETQDFYDDLN